MTDRPAGKRILFVCYGGGHVNMVIPVIQELQRRRGASVLVVGLTTAASSLRRAGIDSLGFKDFLEPGDRAAIEHGRRLMEELPPHPAVDVSESIAYLGLSYRDLEHRLGVTEARTQYARLGRQCFLPLGTMRRIVERCKPDLIVSTNSPRAERASMLVAQERGVPSLCMVDLFAGQGIAWLGSPRYGTRVCVLSDYVRDTLVRAGRTPSEIVVTGNPAFDALAEHHWLLQSRHLKQALRLSRRKLILYASVLEPPINQFTGEIGDPTLPNRIETALIDIVARRKEWALAVRAHPSERLEGGRLRARTKFIRSPRKDPLPLWLHLADTVVLTSSTVGMEAALLGKPVVQIKMSVFSKDAPYAEMGIARGVSHLERLEGALDVVISGSWQPRGAVPAPGGAARRVVDVIQSLVRN